MSSMNPMEYAASILAEVKLQERKLEKLEEKAGALENAIKSALRNSDRERAEKLALELNQVRREVEQKQTFVAEGRQQFEAAKRKAKDLKTNLEAARGMQATAKAMEGVAKSMDVLQGAEDMLRKIEQEVALSEARLDLAGEDAVQKADRVLAEQGALAPEVNAASILAEFEEAEGGASAPAAPSPSEPAAKKSLGGETPPKKTLGPESNKKTIGPDDGAPGES